MPNNDSRRRAASDSNSILSHSSILILSGFLIGLAACRGVHPELQANVCLAGVAGLISYFGLGLLARQRQQRADRVARQQAAWRMERRIHRHVPRLAPMHARRCERTVAATDEQYLTVPSVSRLAKR